MRRKNMRRNRIKIAGFLGLAFWVSGCSLLFVPKGGVQVSRKPPAEAAHAPSLLEQISSSREETYRVQPGDSWWKIAKRFYGRGILFRELAERNGRDPGHLLPAGVLLKIPERLHGDSEASKEGGTKEKTTRVSSAKKNEESKSTGILDESLLERAQNAGEKPRPRKNKAFAAGEFLRFMIHYFSVVAGYATLEVRELTDYQGRPCYRIVATAESAFPFSKFYKVDDYLESLFDAVDFFSWRYIKRTREGGYREDTKILYDPVRRTAVWYKNQDPPREVSILPGVQDVLSSFYYFRLLDFGEGERLAIPTNARGKNYELVVEVFHKEKVKVRAGEFLCWKLRPHVKYDNVFQNKGDIWIWVTADERKVPVLIKSKIIVGSIDIELIDAKLPALKR